MAQVECLCPPKAAGEARHPDGDTVTLRPRLDFEAALTVWNSLILARAATDDNAAIMAALTKQFIFVGIESWTVTDAKGKPVPITRESIADVLMTHQDAAMAVAEEADDLDAEAVVLPFAGPGVELIAAYADARIDISGEWLDTEAPEAITAILDYHYPDGRHRDDYMTARWRLQVIAEMSVGTLVRQAQARQDRSVSRLQKVTNGAR